MRRCRQTLAHNDNGNNCHHHHHPQRRRPQLPAQRRHFGTVSLWMALLALLVHNLDCHFGKVSQRNSAAAAAFVCRRSVVLVSAFGVQHHHPVIQPRWRRIESPVIITNRRIDWRVQSFASLEPEEPGGSSTTTTTTTSNTTTPATAASAVDRSNGSSSSSIRSQPNSTHVGGTSGLLDHVGADDKSISDDGALFTDACRNAVVPVGGPEPAALSSALLAMTATSTTATASDSNFKFGDVVAARFRTNTVATTSTTTSTAAADAATTGMLDQDVIAAASVRRRNVVAVTFGLVLALTQFAWQWTHPIQPIQILASLQQSSAPLSVIGRNGLPTVVDVWAPWCDQCLRSAYTLQQLERDYGRDVNFVLVNGDLRSSWPVIEALHVDAIPHVALIAADGTVETTLIGPIPPAILRADLNVLVTNAQQQQQQLAQAVASAEATANDGGSSSSSASETGPVVDTAVARQELPYKMLDVFAGLPFASRRVSFDQ
jgi:thiol-disulfide isomerase/thioredoxin